jgi:hypothetical protein
MIGDSEFVMDPVVLDDFQRELKADLPDEAAVRLFNRVPEPAIENP